jgi:hypothetical protein
MTRKFLATVLAASMALTSVSVAPARADSGELGRFLLGAGALVIIGSAISNSNRNRGRVEPTRRYVEPTRRYVEPAPRIRHQHKVVPSACLRVNRTDYGPRRYFGQRCLNNNMRKAWRLPESCLRAVPGRHGQRAVFAAHCLRRNGWTFG